MDFGWRKLVVVLRVLPFALDNSGLVLLQSVIAVAQTKFACITSALVPTSPSFAMKILGFALFATVLAPKILVHALVGWMMVLVESKIATLPMIHSEIHFVPHDTCRSELSNPRAGCSIPHTKDWHKCIGNANAVL